MDVVDRTEVAVALIELNERGNAFCEPAISNADYKTGPPSTRDGQWRYRAVTLPRAFAVFCPQYPLRFIISTSKVDANRQALVDCFRFVARKDSLYSRNERKAKLKGSCVGGATRATLSSPRTARNVADGRTVSERALCRREGT